MTFDNNINSNTTHDDVRYSGNNKRRDFTTILPFDVVSAIFSYITKSDCLICMSVSREWLDHVPHYATTLWKKLDISSLETLNNGLLFKCLGPHLEMLRLHRLNECEIATVIQKLAEKGQCNSIRFLEFYQCRTMDRRMLSESFRPIINSLVHLSFLRHTHAIDLHGFLQLCCPKKITHFTFDSSGSSRQAMIMDRDYSIAPPPRNEAVLPKFRFTYLNLHATLYRYEIDYVLEQCPQLKCLLFDSIKPYGHTMTHVIDACARICPDLQCLAWGRIRPDFVSHWRTKASAAAISYNYYQQEQKGLQEIVCGSFYHGGNSFSQMILSHHRTLEVIRLERLQNQPIDPWYPVTTITQQYSINNSSSCNDTVIFEKLRIIHMNNIHVNAESLANWVYSCSNLEELSLHAITSDTQFWLERVFQALSSSKAKLKQLNITHDTRPTQPQPQQQIRNNDDNNSNNLVYNDTSGSGSIYHYNDDENPICTFLVQSRKHQLKSVELGGKGLITNSILHALTVKSNAATLKHIALQYSATENKAAVTPDGLHAFAHNLHWILDELYITEQHQQQENDDGGSLLTDDILILLSTKVKRLILQGCKKITGEGLKKFLKNNLTTHDNNKNNEKNNYNHNYLEYLEIVGCGAKIDNNTSSIEYAKALLGADNVRHIPLKPQNELSTSNTVYFVYT